MLSIKEFSEQVDFSIRMLRYLEEVGLLIPKRDHNNYRVYSDNQIIFAKRIKNLQKLGFQLREIELLKKQNELEQIEIIKNVLKREQEIAEMKSETIPELKNLIDFTSRSLGSIETFFENYSSRPKKLKSLGGEEKFHRTAYHIPILKLIYEDYLAKEAGIELICTDILKFKDWIADCHFIPSVYSILNESSFAFGKNVDGKFIDSFELVWKKYLPEMGFLKLEDFSKDDIQQLMGQHDIIIRTIFKNTNSQIEGEIVIPYTPIYTMSQLSKKN